MRSLSCASISKHSGPLMSSRLMPPKVGSSAATVSTTRSMVVGGDLDVEHVDVGELLEQHRLAFHHRLGGERADIAEAEHGGAVGHHRDQIAAHGERGGLRPDRRRWRCRPRRRPAYRPAPGRAGWRAAWWPGFPAYRDAADDDTRSAALADLQNWTPCVLPCGFVGIQTVDLPLIFSKQSIRSSWPGLSRPSMSLIAAPAP